MTKIISHHMQAHGLRVIVTNYGASLQDLRLLSHDIPLVLGFEEAQDYAGHEAYMGATAGRYANRIANGRFSIDGKDYQLDQNEEGKHTLHGGANGCGRQIWELIEASDDSATFTLTQADGHMGFPGEVHLSCRYQITAHNQLTITYHGVSNAPTIMNLAHHSYFRLDEGDDITDHEVQILADSYLAVDGENIPTGQYERVHGTLFDFRALRRIGTYGYDHNFCLSGASMLRPVANLYSPKSGINMQISSDQCGLQLYTSKHLNEGGKTHHGRPYKPYDGICLEPQHYPNAPNIPHFPSAFLHAKQTYHQILALDFTHDEAS